MYPLVVCSLVSLAVIVERCIFWWRIGRKRDQKLLDELLAEAGRNNFDEAIKMGGESEDFVVRVLCYGLSHRDFGMDNALEIAASEQIDKMKKGLGILDTIITLAPLLGILGTVLGIIQSFDLLGKMGIEEPKAVVGGIAQALITTAGGLTVAILTLLPFNYFQSKVDGAVMLLEKYVNSLEIMLSKGMAGKKSVSVQTARREAS